MGIRIPLRPIRDFMIRFRAHPGSGDGKPLTRGTSRLFPGLETVGVEVVLGHPLEPHPVDLSRGIERHLV
jgi:hypothetical protein